MTSCGKYVITVCQEEEEIKIWNIKVDPPRLLRNVTGKAQCRKVALCHGDEWIAMKLGNGIKVEGLHTGEQCMGKGVAAAKAFFTAGKHKDRIVTLKKTSEHI
ncbi:hypothetical protein DPMN_033481 [Dreissena polymorpha]|uniref:Uncharacterized protein n=1 Tax=Dreissena polymorpha TaxID=45954 RepID=A0A9D4RJ71_DREPO|nr:hypothetical protein DPMN_033481 [Dreissena polymorpha]